MDEILTAFDDAADDILDKYEDADQDVLNALRYQFELNLDAYGY